MEAVTSSTEFRIQTDQDPPSNGSFALSSSSASAVFRKIEFHPARKPFNGISNRGSDFKIETLNPSSANNRAFSATSAKKPDGSDLAEHGLDPELTFTITFRRIGAGLQNLGNTCFLNSVLQCLTYTEPLAAQLQKVAHEKNCPVAGFCALCAMQNHVRIARQANGKILAPKALVSNLRCVSRNFRNCRQEDAHEYMINLLECMHKCCLPSGVPSESSDAYRSSLVHKIFGGSLRSQVKCAQCSHCSDKFDPFLDLSLDISKADSLQRALARFTAVELLDDGAKVYQCERCKQKVKALKQLTVSKAPPYVLTVHLKRFEAHRSEKIDKKVDFPSAIDMKPFVSGPYQGNLKYTLYGVLVHYGPSAHSGHYACFVRTSNGMWHSLDDKEVVSVSEKKVFNQKAYMLFYVRDRQNTAPKNAVTVVKKETAKDSLSINRNDKVNGSTDIKACSLDALVANGTPLLRSCGQGAPAVFSHKDLNAKDTEKGRPSIMEAKEILQRENGTAPLKSGDQGAPAVFTQKDLSAKVIQRDPSNSMEAKEILTRENGTSPLRSCDQGAPSVLTQKDLNAKETQKDSLKEIVTGDNGTRPLRSCDLGAPAGLTQRDLNAKETLQKELPLSQAKGEESLGKANTQILVNLPTSGASAENSVDQKNSVKNLDESANSLKVKNVSIGYSSIQEPVLINPTLGHRSEESDTLTESIKATSDAETLTQPRKTRKRNMKNLPVGLKFFKRTLCVLKKKKQKRGRSGTLAVNIISKELLSKKSSTDEAHSTSQITREGTSGSGCLHGKDNSVSVHNKRIRSSSNGNVLLGSQTGELKERTNQNGAVLASDQQQPLTNSGLSEASQNAKRKREPSKEEQISSQKEQETILTRGLPETVVAKWGEEVSASKIRKSESTRVGYVADEWDEEYDRGKKKKIRIKEEMRGGPNPFQVIASRRLTDTKKKWTQRMNTAKKGLRI
uniref:Ubiquitin carboxyl-terminal hydrolase n=1 Tax=Noccaea caerulescens TaxID=107243 RepID=A0A1J3IK99_NOCCA